MEPNQSTEALDEIMDEEKRLTDHLSETSTWIRLLHMILFGVIFRITEWVIFLIAVVQILFKLFTGEPNPRLRSLGRSLAGYVRETAAFLTFDTEDRPYPWSDWPSGEETKAAAATKKPAAAAKKRPATRPRRRAASRSATAPRTTQPRAEAPEARSAAEPSVSETAPTEPQPPGAPQSGTEPAPSEPSSEEPRPAEPGTDANGDDEPKDRGGGTGI